MTESKNGLFQRGLSPLIKLEVMHKDDYITFAKKAARRCKLGDGTADQELCLFKMNGARIVNDGVTVRGKKKNVDSWKSFVNDEKECKLCKDWSGIRSTG